MIQLISKLQISINQRFDHISMLTIDSQQMVILIKDDDKKRNIVRSFRIIKASQKTRTIQQSKCISLISKLGHKLTKHEIIVCESMVTNCINQYLNTEYIIRKNGDPNDLIDVFLYYYNKIKAFHKVSQLTVIRNCSLLFEMNFMGDNLQYFVTNIQLSMNSLYDNQKNKFFNLLKKQNKQISPQKRTNQQEQDQRFDGTGNLKGKKKRQLQQYCFQMSKILNLQHIYLDYFYFSTMDLDKRKKTLESNYLKRNILIKNVIHAYEKQYLNYKMRHNKQQKRADVGKRGIAEIFT